MAAQTLGTVIFVIVAITAFLLGVFILKNPEKTFAIQQRFYRMINWYIEPVSFEKEMRNTRLMGLFLVLFVAASVLYYFL